MTVRVTNAAEITLFTPTADIPLATPFYGLWNGTRFWIGDSLTLEDENGVAITQLDDGASVTIPAGAIDLDFPDGEFTDVGMDDIITAGFDRTLELSIHNQDPTDNGSQGELSGSGYSRESLPFSTWTIAPL